MHHLAGGTQPALRVLDCDPHRLKQPRLVARAGGGLLQSTGQPTSAAAERGDTDVGLLPGVSEVLKGADGYTRPRGIQANLADLGDRPFQALDRLLRPLQQLMSEFGTDPG